MKNYLNFEPLSQENAEKLIGGFSNALEADFEDNDDAINNCKGGNCKTGCNNKGKKKKKGSKPIPNGNCGAGKNCVEGCGN